MAEGVNPEETGQDSQKPSIKVTDRRMFTPDGRLRNRGTALRLRLEGGKSRVTFKGPIQPGVMKVREELETIVGDGEVLLRIFEELGFHYLGPFDGHDIDVLRRVLAIAKEYDDRPVLIHVVHD